MKFGIIGTNFISDRFVASLPFAESEVTAVLSRREDTGRAFAERHGISHVFTDEAAFLASDAFHAVYVASPNSAHEAHSVAALRAGKHVLCEKPVAPSFAAWERMKEAARESGCVLMEAMRPLHDSFWRTLRDALPMLGRIRSAHLDYCQYSSRYDKFRAGEVLRAFDPSYCNAAMLDIGVYPIALAVFLFGAPHTVLGHSVMLPHGFEGAGSALLGYREHTVSISYAKIADSLAPSSILGEEGSMTFDRVSEPTVAHVRLRTGEELTLTRPQADTPDNMLDEVRDFILAVHGEGDTFWHESDRTLRIMDALRAQNGIVFPNEL